MCSKRGTILESQAREIILSVDTYFDQERQRAANALKRMILINGLRKDHSAKGVLVPHDLFKEVLGLLKNTCKRTLRVAEAAGINKNTVTRIRAEGQIARASSSKIPTPVKAPRGPKIKLDKNEITALRNIIRNLHEDEQKIPSIGQIFKKAQDELNFPRRKSTLLRIMKKQLGLKYEQIGNEKVLLIKDGPEEVMVGVEKIQNENSNSDSCGFEEHLKFECSSPDLIN